MLQILFYGPVTIAEFITPKQAIRLQPGLSGQARLSPNRLGLRFTVVIPFYNEEGFIPRTLRSILTQELKPAYVLLVDNGSTDRSAELCRTVAAAQNDVEVRILSEPRPGKIYALEKACSQLSSDYVAFCDADTIYPPHYLRQAYGLFEAGGPTTVAVMAVGLRTGPHTLRGAFARWKGAAMGQLFAKQCHAGGFGQVFRAKTFLAAGGYDPQRWPYVLEDHEIVQRVLKLGECRYDPEFWCQTADRRRDRKNVSWSFVERILYHLTPFSLKDWYFRKFLAPRLAKRGLMNARLRHQPWAKAA